MTSHFTSVSFSYTEHL